ncbi:MAG: energy-coupling factor transporter ATPase [Desulfobacterales bacterium]|nr:ATP-binding cassette domain-containing protein [Pseudomonadota bacterium]MBU4355621.1 ATP-binding cassette domain-containing protein [Pseudomonadota bacterium]MCG2771702.1 energy-coupling factor transporter ATPase [Desulfobacterales bacterium]
MREVWRMWNYSTMVVLTVLTATCRPRQLAGRVGILLQDFEAQLVSTRVDQEVAFGPENLGLPREELRRRVAEFLAHVGLDGLDDRDPATLSGGQRQLLALAAVLSLAPKLLVLDEPTTDLDPVRVEELLATLDRLSRTRDLTLVFLGEDLRLARFCSRIVLLARGKILADGPAEVILREVERLRGLGLNPPELPALFHDLGQATLPLTLAEAVDQARGLGWDQPIIAAGDQASEPGGRGRPPHEGEILALRRVSFAYPDAPLVVQDFSLAFRERELTAILGPNGSGKTTVLKLLRGLLTPQAGEVWQPPDEKFRVGYVFQNPDYQLFAEEVWEEVAFGVRLLGLSPPEVERRVTTALTRVHLLDLARDDPFSLTKGQRQRLAVAGVLALAPQVIILDEPTTGLDHREQQDLLGLARELHAQGHTVIMVTHSMWAAATYARRLVVLLEGKVLLDGPAREVMAERELLARARLVPPAVVQLSRGLGFMALTPAEFCQRVGGRA